MWEDGELGVLFSAWRSKRKESVELLSQERPIEISQAKMEMQMVPQKEGRAHLIPEERCPAEFECVLEAKSQRTA